MSTREFVYTFVSGEITDALIVIDRSNAHLVYASLGKNKPALLKIAKDDFNKLYKKLHSEYKFECITDEIKAKQPRLNDIIEEYKKLLSCEKHYYDCTIPYDYIFGTPFQRKVWIQLHKLTPGKTISYGHLAAEVGSPKGQRAIARSCASNKLALLIPCHCVLNNKGEFHGYRWGVDIKKQFLQRL
ncbi:methylated-DNA--protein-cysteine methyltransferase [Monosporozyma unispora]|nr:methylated-DNA--protein-cysteine methyltransferase [Kazachstania unispora]